MEKIKIYIYNIDLYLFIRFIKFTRINYYILINILRVTKCIKVPVTINTAILILAEIKNTATV